ncbi:hypothetical protein IMG5_041520, partial [Ichthyophthirius multifiliis]
INGEQIQQQQQNIFQKNDNPKAFFFGQIVGGVNFDNSNGLFCEMVIEIGPKWKLKNCLQQPQIIQQNLIESIQTQTAYADQNNLFLWSHPFDFEFETSTVNGWPKAIFKVWNVDYHNKIDIVSYGIMNFPNHQGFHKIKINTWSPLGNWQYGNQQIFLGNQARLSNLDFVKYHEDKDSILGQSNGQIIVEFD